jgi:hypothetical protein
VCRAGRPALHFFSSPSPGDAGADARRSEEKTVIEEKPRHCWLNPESSLSIKFLRRFAPEFYDSGFRVKPGMTRC